MLYRLLTASGLFVIAAWTCFLRNGAKPAHGKSAYAPGTGPIDQLALPAPFATPSARNTFESDRLAEREDADAGAWV